MILLEVSKSSEVRFHGAVLSLNLAVSPRVKSGRKPSFNAEKVAKR